MAKKSKNTPKQRKQAKNLSENVLPQNILPMGERVEQDKNIYISQDAYKQIHKFTKNKTTNESGGMLIGTVIEALGKTNIIISGFVEAKYCEGTPTTLTFTHETWDYVHKEVEKKHKGKKILGWIHTHPDFGIFLSEYDKFIHQNFFSEAYQVAYVVDPIQKIEGFYFWINGNIEKCSGFYIYDKTGNRITVSPEKDTPAEEATTSVFSVKNVLIALLTVAVVFLLFSNISASKQLKQLANKQQKLEENSAIIGQILYDMQQYINTQEAEIQKLNNALAEAGIVEAPDESIPDIPDDPTGENTDTTEGGTTNE